MKHIYDMVILGGGPGGFTAALYAARSGLDTLVVERLSAGGQMALTPQIDNYPGFPDGVDGVTLGQKMRRGAERFGAKTVQTEALSLRAEGEIKEISTGKGELFARTLVIATGAGPRRLGLAGEEHLVGRGVSYCAACDGMLYRGKTVALAGGGNSAAADALTLSRICKKVILLHRRDSLRATRVYHEALKNTPNVVLRWNSVVTELLGEERLTGIKVKNLLSGGEETLFLDGLFISVGRVPATELVRGQLELDEGGCIVAGESTETSVPGVYAVGDVRSKALRQIVTATADGAMAAARAEEYLENSAL